MYPDPSSPRIILWFSDLHLPILLGVITVDLLGGKAIIIVLEHRITTFEAAIQHTARIIIQNLPGKTALRFLGGNSPPSQTG